eukprot:jgi/Psemu1/296124/fgenesh1_pm.125_\
MPSSNNEEEPTTIRWGIVGLGDVTQVKSGPPFWKCEGSELVAVMRRTPGKAAEFAARVPTSNRKSNSNSNSNSRCVGYDDLDRFLEHPGLEAVYVCTRPGTHASIARKVADAGLACYIEKPVGRCAAETRELAELFDRKALPFYTAYISRAYERTRTVKQLIASGALGDKLVSITYRLRGTGGARDMSTKELPWRLDASQSGGGLIMDVGCHVIDRIDYLCGPLQDVKGSAEHKRSGNENEAILDDVGVAVENYCHASATIGAAPWAALSGCEGATVDLEWDFSITDPSDAFDELRFVGSNGRTLRMAGMSPNGPIEVLDTGMETDTDTDGDGDGTTVVESMAFDMPEHTGQGLIQAVTNDLIDRKKGKGSNEERERERPDFLSFGDNAIRAQTVIDTMLESYYGGREIGYWTRVDSWPGRTVGGDPKK